MSTLQQRERERGAGDWGLCSTTGKQEYQSLSSLFSPQHKRRADPVPLADEVISRQRDGAPIHHHLLHLRILPLSSPPAGISDRGGCASFSPAVPPWILPATQHPFLVSPTDAKKAPTCLGRPRLALPPSPLRCPIGASGEPGGCNWLLHARQLMKEKPLPSCRPYFPPPHSPHKTVFPPQARTRAASSTPGSAARGSGAALGHDAPGRRHSAPVRHSASDDFC